MSDVSKAAWARASALAVTVAVVGFGFERNAHGQDLEFNRDIRPVLSEYCFACHGPDANHREADLRLDDREAAIDFGAIVPGEPEASLLVERILSDEKKRLNSRFNVQMN